MGPVVGMLLTGADVVSDFDSGFDSDSRWNFVCPEGSSLNRVFVEGQKEQSRISESGVLPKQQALAEEGRQVSWSSRVKEQVDSTQAFAVAVQVEAGGSTQEFVVAARAAAADSTPVFVVAAPFVVEFEAASATSSVAGVAEVDEDAATRSIQRPACAIVTDHSLMGSSAERCWYPAADLSSLRQRY
jgi:hypothetical protein